MKHGSRIPLLEPLEDRTLMSICHVTRLSDQGIGMGFRGDLRFCVNKVNANPGADIIDFHVSGAINLQSALPGLSSDINMQGPGANVLTVRRDAGVGFRVFDVPAGATVSISGLTISNGTAACSGGGIASSGTLTISYSTVSGNTMIGCEVGYGGGIYNDGVLAVDSSTIVGNVATGFLGGGWAGGIGNFGTMTVVNSTISGNSADNGGGIFNVSGTATILNSTIASNSAADSGGGVRNIDTLHMRNAIVANNTANFSGPDFDGTLASSGDNLFGNSSGGSGYVGSDILDVDPKLSALANNGGPTLTHALRPGSLAIDAGDNTGAPSFDQRGPGFTRVVNGTIDIGAFEVQATNAPSGPRLRAFLITADFGQNEWEILP